MNSGITKMQVLSIYKSLLRESQKFTNYNFRAYALRRIRDAFRENKVISERNLVKKEYAYAIENLEIMRRQTSIGQMFQTEKLVIENRR